MGLKDFTAVGASKLMANNRDIVNTLGAFASWATKNDKEEYRKEIDPFSLSEFRAKLRDDGGRLSKNYYFNAKLYLTTKYVSSEQPVTMFKFAVDKINIPGWRARTQQGKIYGINYEIATELEQDPIWITFNVDIRHEMSELFFSTIKTKMFSESFSPKYKDSLSFEMEIDVTDENFKPLYTYTFHNSILKTVQQINMGQGNSDITQISAEIVYESVDVKNVGSGRIAAEANENVKNKNNLPFGPFNVDISAVNQTIDMYKRIPEWFNEPTKI